MVCYLSLVILVFQRSNSSNFSPSPVTTKCNQDTPWLACIIPWYSELVLTDFWHQTTILNEPTWSWYICMGRPGAGSLPTIQLMNRQIRGHLASFLKANHSIPSCSFCAFIKWTMTSHTLTAQCIVHVTEVHKLVSYTKQRKGWIEYHY